MTTSRLKQHLVVATEIKELILRGQLAPGERVTEAGVAEMLGLSRTPVRQALPILAQEGYLTAAGRRGYAVKTFTVEESATALEARAVLEGMAARSAAEKGLSPAATASLNACLAEGDEILRSGLASEELWQAYGDMNKRFHDLLVEAANKPLLADLVSRCSAVPFVAPDLMASKLPSAELFTQDLLYAHRQHHSIVEAILRREALRVEMLLREHATVQRHSMSL